MWEVGENARRAAVLHGWRSPTGFQTDAPELDDLRATGGRPRAPVHRYRTGRRKPPPTPARRGQRPSHRRRERRIRWRPVIRPSTPNAGRQSAGPRGRAPRARTGGPGPAGPVHRATRDLRADQPDAVAAGRSDIRVAGQPGQPDPPAAQRALQRRPAGRAVASPPHTPLIPTLIPYIPNTFFIRVHPTLPLT